ncbi:EAL domain-containing protein [Kordiimonas marina]|uniref:EAL domain-containing protein n=1 Tax=Kordiimonas marina TaxID=2872312 RepID=UPI001FF6E432|nr:EAL domain-containing protein [Kordiimonas marina]MCJ9428458.1 EAL domain-containing protein [Kordiimonas marina]
MLVFFGAWQLQSFFMTRKEATETKARLDQLEDMMTILRGDMERTRRDVDSKAKVSGEKSDKLVSELKVLHTLLTQVMTREIALKKGGKGQPPQKAAPQKAVSAPAEAAKAESEPEVQKQAEMEARAAEVDIDEAEARAAKSVAADKAAEPAAGEPAEDAEEDRLTQEEIEELELTPEEAALAVVDTGEEEEPAIEGAAAEGGTESAPGGGATPRGMAGRGKKAAIRLIKREDQLLSVIRSSLSENRVDLYLQPIVGLPARKIVHYECFSRVRDEEGRIILPRQYMRVAESKGLIGTIDNLLLFRLIQLVRRLGRRKPDVRFFCNMSRYSMTDAEFFPQFIDFMTANEEFAGRLVFEISQEDFYTLETDVLERLMTLGRKGFGFSMDMVKDFERDFPALGKQHFQFIKSDVRDLMSTHPEEGDVEAFKSQLRRNGMELIASRIESEEMVLEALDAEVELAQGYLFGEPASSTNLTREL